MDETSRWKEDVSRVQALWSAISLMERIKRRGENNTAQPVFIWRCGFGLGCLALLFLGVSTMRAAEDLPIIVSQPESQIVNSGDSASFRVVAEGTAPLSYQWRFNGTNLSNATEATLVLTNVQPAHIGHYSVVVANAAGTNVSEAAYLNVCWDFQLLLASQYPDVTNQTWGLLGSPNYPKFDAERNLHFFHDIKGTNGFGILKLSPAWQPLWHVEFQKPQNFNDFYSTVIKVDPAGNTYIADPAPPNATTNELRITKLDFEGKQVWSSQFSYIGKPFSVEVDKAGGVTVLGGIPNQNTGSQDSFEFTRISPSGQRLWQKTFTDLNNHKLRNGAIGVDSEGNIYLATDVNNYGPSNEWLLAKFDTNGTLAWVKPQPDPTPYGWFAPTSVLVDHEDNLFICVSFSLGAPGVNFLTMKYGTNGNHLWSVSHPSSMDDLHKGVSTLDEDGNLYFAVIAGAIVWEKYNPDGKRVGSTRYSLEGTGVWPTGEIALGIDDRQNVQVGAHFGNFFGPATNLWVILDYAQNTTPGRPIIANALTDKRAPSGSTVSFAPVVRGTPPFYIQWRKNGAPLSEATNAVLMLSNVVHADSGKYSLLITNLAGCALSPEFSLTVVDIQLFQLDQVGIATNQINFRFTGENNRRYTIDVSTDLVNWFSLMDLYGNTRPQSLTFPTTNGPAKFYRVQTWP